MNAVNIQLINTEDIHPHPGNPRKDLGDLSELTESVKINGVMQNLTVIPNIDSLTGKYTAVIGHRRLEAAKQAGLDLVPCVVAEMDDRQQISTMLLENMQRSDLTVLEQAQGMQMMMDLGDSIKEICEKTGFAETTVRHRIKITELDQETVKKCMKKQIGINDFIKLEKIKDIELRNGAAKYLGTSSFDWNYKSALEKDNWKTKSKEILEDLSTFAEDITDADREGWDYSHYKYVSSYNCDRWETPEDKDKVEYVYTVDSNNGSISVYYQNTDNDDEEITYEPSPEELEEKQKKELAKELQARAYNLRRDFIMNRKYSANDMTYIIGEYVRQSIECNVSTAHGWQWIDYLGLETNRSDFCYESIKAEVEADPLKYLALNYMADMDGDGKGYCTRWGNFGYESNESLDDIYIFLQGLGYEMSDDEKRLQDGTHEIFDGTGEDDEE